MTLRNINIQEGNNMYNFKMNKESPFTPGNVVKLTYFVGRKQELEIIFRHIPDIIHGNNRHFYLVGKRGMGKSSLSENSKHILEKQMDMIVLHIANDGIDSLEKLITSIIESLLEEIEIYDWSKKIIKTFEDNIESVGFMNLNIKLKTRESEDIAYLIRHFAEFLKRVCANFENKKNGLIIIIDDVNGLSNDEKFANWYKSFVTKLDSYIDEKIPVGFILTSYPQNFNKLKSLNPSFTRIFNVINVNKLSEDDVTLFYRKVFKDKEMKIDDKALEIIVKYSYGMPLMMHEIGYAIYWLCGEDKHVTTSLAFNGIKRANENIKNKYLHESIANTNFESILRILSTYVIPSVNDRIVIPEIKKNLLEEEKDLLDIFLIEAKSVGIIESVDYKLDETYEFINPLYTIFMKINNI